MKSIFTLFFMIFLLCSCSHATLSKNENFTGKNVSKDEHYSFVESGASRFR